MGNCLIASGCKRCSIKIRSNFTAAPPTPPGIRVPAKKNLGSVFFDSADKATTYPHFTSAQIVDGGLIVQPENIAFVTVQGGHFPEGVYHAFDYSLFFENLKANIAERIDAFTHK